jgi:hypothetical protein
MYLHKKTLTVFMVMLVTLFTGCGGGSGTSSIDTTLDTTLETTSGAKTTELVSYGFKVVDLEDTSSDITLTFDTATGATAESIPLWYYDYEQEIWFEEGSAILQADGTYVGTVSHAGTWSLGQPVEDDYTTYTDYTIYTDRIIDPDETPVTNLRVDAIGDNWIRTDFTTDENGVFEIEVIPGEEFTLQVYHYDENYSAKYSGKIIIDAAGEIAYKIN